jgi:pilus assembly protein Flp/PilA
VLSLIQRFHQNERGATGTEYAMLVVFIALAIAVGAQTLGTDLSGLFSKIGGTLSNVTVPTPPAPGQGGQ